MEETKTSPVDAAQCQMNTIGISVKLLLIMDIKSLFRALSTSVLHDPVPPIVVYGLLNIIYIVHRYDL